MVRHIYLEPSYSNWKKEIYLAFFQNYLNEINFKNSLCIGCFFQFLFNFPLDCEAKGNSRGSIRTP